MSLETKTVLVTVKAYPNPSRKYTETVCCAGIDIDTKKWIRLYPIPYRDLDESQKFKKYNIIKVRCEKAQNDPRIESYRVNSDSIQIIDHLDTKKKWQLRKELVLPMPSDSFCQILADTQQHKSLGLFKPSEVGFHWKKSNKENQRKRQACYAQLTFFDKKKEAIEKIPFDFYYSFKCNNCCDCPRYKLPIIDWELGQTYRSWRYKYKKQEVLLEQIKHKWFDKLCGPDRDVYFYVGNMRYPPRQFMILGVFYPPKTAPTLFKH